MEKFQANYLITIKDQDVLRDLPSLVSLYEPIIGAQALALYLCLINEAAILKQLNYPKFELARLYQISSLNEKNFHEAIKKLESLRLVKSKVSRKTGVKKYEIFSPLEPNEFFANELFERTLGAKVGLENVEALKFLFKEKTDYETEDDFVDVTAGFEEVFAEELAKIATIPCLEDTDFTNLRRTKKTILEKMLDLDLLTSLLKKVGVKINYNSLSVKKSLNWALSIHNFNEESLATIISSSFDYEKKKLDLKYFEKAVKNLVVEAQQTSQTPVKNPNFAPLKTQISEAEFNQVNLMKVKNPVQVVQELTQTPPDLTIRKMIRTLNQDYQLENGAVNYLIEFSCFKNQNRVVANYIYKIANSLKEFGLTRSVDVMVYLSQLKQVNCQRYEGETHFNHQSSTPPPVNWQPLSAEEIVKMAAEM